MPGTDTPRMSRPGTHLLDESRRLRIRWLRRVWWVYACAVAFLLTLLTVTVITSPPLTLPVILLIGAAFGYLIGDTIQYDGGRNLREGAGGEDNTARVLRQLRRHGFRIEHNVALHLRDIDHVAIGEHGAVAVESKYTNQEWTLTADGIVETTLGGTRRTNPWPVHAARRAARDLRLIALSARARVEVLPVVVIWGPRVTSEVDVAARVDGVLVVAGRDWKQWLGLLAAGSLTADGADRVWRAVVTRKREHVAAPGRRARLAA
jgi:hypothetical protein